jgi:hypothetical protein
VLLNVGESEEVKTPVVRKLIEPACELAPQRSAPHSAAPKIQVFLHPIASCPLMLNRSGKKKRRRDFTVGWQRSNEQIGT